MFEIGEFDIIYLDGAADRMNVQEREIEDLVAFETLVSEVLRARVLRTRPSTAEAQGRWRFCMKI